MPFRASTGEKRPRADRYSTWAAPKHDRPSLWAVNQRHSHAAALLRTHQRHITPLNGGIEPAAVLCSRRACPPGSEPGVVPRETARPAPSLVWYRAERPARLRARCGTARGGPPGSEPGVVPRGAARPAPSLVWYRAERPARLRYRAERPARLRAWCGTARGGLPGPSTLYEYS